MVVAEYGEDHVIESKQKALVRNWENLCAARRDRFRGVMFWIIGLSALSAGM